MAIRSPSSLQRVFLWPALLFMIVLALVPTLAALNLSLRDDMLGQPGQYVWLRNFIALATDARFLNALRVSAVWEALTLLLTLVTAVLIGVFLFERTQGRIRTVVSVLFIMPVLLPRVSAAFLWRFMLDPLVGVVNYPVRQLTGAPINFVGNPHLALGTVALVDVWQWGLFFAVIILKLLETLPRPPFEAARLDRARAWQVYWYVALPMLRAPLIGLAFVKAIESLRSFDLIYVMTRGGPGITTETLDMYAYSQAFVESSRISYASAMAVLMLILTNIVFSLVWKRAKL